MSNAGTLAIQKVLPENRGNFYARKKLWIDQPLICQVEIRNPINGYDPQSGTFVRVGPMMKKDGSPLRAIRVPNLAVGEWMQVSKAPDAPQTSLATRKRKARRQMIAMEKRAHVALPSAKPPKTKPWTSTPKRHSLLEELSLGAIGDSPPSRAGLQAN